MRLLQHGLGRQSDQLGVLADSIRFAAQAHHAHHPAFGTQGQVDARSGIVQALRDRLVDLNCPPLRQHQQRTLVAGPEARAIAAGDDQPALVHHIDVGAQDLHRAIDDGLGERGIEQEHDGAPVADWTGTGHMLPRGVPRNKSGSGGVRRPGSGISRQPARGGRT